MSEHWTKPRFLVPPLIPEEEFPKIFEEEFPKMMHASYVPLSVEYGNWRKKLGWWLKGRRENIALRFAPWFRGPLEVARTKPQYQGFVHLTGGPKDGERIKCRFPMGKEAHFPGHEQAGGRYVRASSAYEHHVEHHVGYIWQDDS